MIEFTSKEIEVLQECFLANARRMYIHSEKSKEAPIYKKLEAMKHSDNTCWGCEYRKPEVRDYINVCLLDESKECIRDER